MSRTANSWAAPRGRTRTQRLLGYLGLYLLALALTSCGGLPSQLIQMQRPLPSTPAMAESVQLEQRVAKLSEAGQVLPAIPLASRALQIRRAGLPADHPALAVSLTWLGTLYGRVGDHAKAVPLMREALAVCERAYGPMHLETATCVSNLGSAYRDAGDFDAALPYLQRALALREGATFASQEVIAESLSNLAGLYQEQGRYEKALPIFQQVLVITEKTQGPSHVDTARALNNFVLVYYQLGAYDKALPFAQRALAIVERALPPEHPDVGNGLNQLASVNLAIGAYDKALPMFQRALTIEERSSGPDSAAAATTLDNLSATYQAMGLNEKALTIALRAQSILERRLPPDHPGLAIGMNSVASSYRLIGAPDKALPLYRRALVLASDGRSPETQWHVLSSLAKVYRAQRSSAQAIFFGKLAVNAIQGMRVGYASLGKDLSRSYLWNKADVYRDLANDLAAEGRYPEALEVLLLLKQDEVREYLSNPPDSLHTLVPYSSAEIPWGSRFDEISARLRAASLSDAPASRARTVPPAPAIDARAASEPANATRAQLTLLLGSIDQEARKPRPPVQVRGAALTLPLVETLRRTLSGKGAGTVALHYLVAEERVRIFFSGPDGLIARDAGVTVAQLNSLIDTFRSSLQSPSTDPVRTAQELYRLLIEPIRRDLERVSVKTLVLSLDSRLRYIPFAALHDGKRYLIENFRVAMLSTAGNDEPMTRRKWEVAGMGLTHAVDIAAGLPPEMTRFDALPGVEKELRAIVRSDGSADGLPGIVKLDQQFSEAALKSALDRPYPVLHLATHFSFKAGSADASYLVLGNGRALPVGELNSGQYNFAGVDLLALSACETALGGGQGADGKEIESFAALARLKGARSVLASLWKVNDASTATLMSRFYAIHERGVGKADSLHDAQVSLLSGNDALSVSTEFRAGDSGGAKPLGGFLSPTGRTSDRLYAHPFYWAPFILMGDWL